MSENIIIGPVAAMTEDNSVTIILTQITPKIPVILLGKYSRRFEEDRDLGLVRVRLETGFATLDAEIRRVKEQIEGIVRKSGWEASVEIEDNGRDFGGDGGNAPSPIRGGHLRLVSQDMQVWVKKMKNLGCPAIISKQKTLPDGKIVRIPEKVGVRPDTDR